MPNMTTTELEAAANAIGFQKTNPVPSGPFAGDRLADEIDEERAKQAKAKFLGSIQSIMNPKLADAITIDGKTMPFTGDVPVSLNFGTPVWVTATLTVNKETKSVGAWKINGEWFRRCTDDEAKSLGLT